MVPEVESVIARMMQGVSATLNACLCATDAAGDSTDFWQSSKELVVWYCDKGKELFSSVFANVRAAQYGKVLIR